jgi:integrase
MLLAYNYLMTTRNGKPYKTGEYALTPTEYDRLLEACSSIEDETLIKFTVATGLRRADVVRVELQNLDTDSGKVTFSEKKKGGRIRTIYVGPKLRQLLNKYLKTIPKNQKMLFGFSERTAYNKLQRLCDIASIPKRPFHALRATCMKRCQRAGWTPEQVVDLTGDTLRVIQEHYATPSSSEMQEVSVLKEIV